MRPALTAEEWKATSWAVSHHSDQYEVTRYDDGLGVNCEYIVTSDGLAKLAALALYGQSFGFTREDVRVLRSEGEFVGTGGLMDHATLDALDDSDFDPPDADLTQSQRRERLENIADRIEALLPPEEK